MDKVMIAVYFNGGFPRHYYVTRGFYERFTHLLDTKWRDADVVVQLLTR